ncbi:MAG: DUF3488 and transglutaminase-like domain-containing protein [Chloroflexota bacterium]|nr:DUF3488 and transglutaminase-like domain-containing protein [Chloroflexota bacterium]
MVNRFFAWLLRRYGMGGLLALGLLLILVASVTLGLAAVTRGLDKRFLLGIAALGVWVGWELARQEIPTWLGLGAAFSLGLGGSIVWVGRLDKSLLGLFHTWRVPWTEHPLATLLTDVTILLIRTRDWALALIGGEPGYDPVVVAMVWSLLLWSVAAWAGWSLRRYDQPLVTVLPGGALLLLTLSYSGDGLFYLLPVLAAAFLLMALMGHIARERDWAARGVDYSREIRADLFFAALPLALALTAVAAIAPPLSPQALGRAIQQLIGPVPIEVKPLADSLGVEQRAKPPSAFDEVRTPGLPRRHLIGSGPELSQRSVMTIKNEAGESTEALVRRWRSLTYDRYSGRGWSAGRTQTVSYEAGERASEVTPPSHQLVHYYIQMERPTGGLLYAPGSLVSVDQPYTVAWRSSQDAFGVYTEATAYTVESALPIVSSEQLRAAGNRYPRWISRRYLALPDRVPERVLALARELTATEPTPYDRARAIEQYLRTFPYNLDLPAPPPGREIADYFLFDLKQGYCDYYATTMVVLARAAGLPARLAIGYTGGAYDDSTQQYLVTEANAHSWVQIYFPDHGWIDFEPTAGRAQNALPEEAPPVETPLLEESGWWERFTQFHLDEGWQLAFLGGVALILAIGLAWVVWDNWRLRHLPPRAAVVVLYERFYRLARWLSAVEEAGATPYEIAESLAQQLNGDRNVKLAGHLIDGRLRAALRPAPAEARWLTDLYVQSTYAPTGSGPNDRSEALQTWKQLRRRLWLAWLLARLLPARYRNGLDA